MDPAGVVASSARREGISRCRAGGLVFGPGVRPLRIPRVRVEIRGAEVRHRLRPPGRRDDLEVQLARQRKESLHVLGEAANAGLFNDARGLELGPRPVPPVRRDLGQPVVRVDLADQVADDLQAERFAGRVAGVDHAEDDDFAGGWGGVRGRVGGDGREGVPRIRHRNQLHERARDLVGHEYAFAIRVDADHDRLVSHLDRLHDGHGLKVHDRDRVAARVVDDRVEPRRGNDHREGPRAEPLGDPVGDGKGRRIDESQLVRTTAGHDIGDLIGRERAPRGLGTNLHRGVGLHVEQVDHGDGARVKVGDERV